MHSLLLINSTGQQFSVEAVKRVFLSAEGFQRIRYETSVGSPIEADFVEGEDFTTVELDEKRRYISTRGTSGAALSAVWILKTRLDVPLRMFDTENSFDLLISQFSSREELERAIDEARSE